MHLVLKVLQNFLPGITVALHNIAAVAPVLSAFVLNYDLKLGTI
jgi:hypothetical protein